MATLTMATDYGSTHYRCSAFLDGEPANGECS